MQQLTKGQTNEPPREGDSSESNDSSETNVMPEEIPDELGHEWRVLHPFELPGVRFPTDSTPPNQRRLAENDALVELIQKTEYLDDVPMWGHRDYRLYPPQYGDTSYRGRGRGRGRGRHKWLLDRQIDRPNGGFGRGFSCGNGIEVQQVQTGRTHPNRQKEDWSTPATTERRETDIGRHESPRAPPPPAPPPTDERLFTDWSSMDSPRERISQCDNIARHAESNINQTDNQTEQPGPEPARSETRGNTLGDIVTLSSTCQQSS